MNTGKDGVRLNKFISDTGICSRREADRLIEEGAVKVNGRLADMGMRVGAGDSVSVRGRLLKAKPAAVYLAFNKPVGVTCTTDRNEPANIVDAVRYPGRIFPVGRLDKDSEGLILLTNDGDAVNKILRAGNAHEKEYVVTLDRPFSGDLVNKLAGGVPILGTVTRSCQVRQIGADTFNIILTQGLNRQIRRMAEHFGFNVTRLKRVRIMHIPLGNLRPGEWRQLKEAEVAALENRLADSSKTEAARRPQRRRAFRKESGGLRAAAYRQPSGRRGKPRS